MKYNLAKYSQITSSGTITLSFDDLLNINDQIAAGIKVGPGVLYIDCDLGNRVHIDQIRYYTDSPTVSFYFKNEDFETFTDLTSYAAGSYYYTTISGYSAPRYLKIKHELSASGTINGLVVQNNENYVDFGTTGDINTYNINATLENNIVQINEMAVYNSSPQKATANIFIELQNSAVDDLLFISDNESGPWYGVYQDEDKIVGIDLWDSSTLNDTEVISNTLKLQAGATEGTLISRILELDDPQKLTFIIVDRDYLSKTQTIEFQDDFNSAVNNNWTVFNGSSLYFNGSNMRMGYSDGTDIRSDVFEFSDDWYFKCKLYEQDEAANWNFYLAGNKIRIYFNLGHAFVQNYNIRFYINGVEKWNETNTTVINDNYQQQWFWIIVQREFNTVRFKIWPDVDPEPGTWNYEGTINPNDISTTGYIKYYFNDFTNTRYVYTDDVTLIKYYTSTGTGYGLLAVDDYDTNESIEVKSSNTKPLDREEYIYTYNDGGMVIRYAWLWDGTLSYDTSTGEPWGSTAQYHDIYYDNKRDDIYVIAKNIYTPGNNNIYFHIFRKDESHYEITKFSGDYDNNTKCSIYKLAYNQNGGFWVYYYMGSDSQTLYYHLEYYDASLNMLYQELADEDEGTFVYDLSAIYDSNGDMWYTNSVQNVIFKLDRNGNILITKTETANIRGVLALSDGGCWYIREAELIRLNSSGIIIDRFDLPSDTVSYIYEDPGDNSKFWLHDGITIRYIDNTGHEIFNIEIENLNWFTPIQSGVVAKVYDYSASTYPEGYYISKYYQRIMRTWNYPRTENSYKGTLDYNRYGFRSQTFDDTESDHASYFPIVPDTTWNNLEWKKVSLRDYNLSNEIYQQIRLTLRATSSTDSPEVYGMWVQRAIEISNILPGQYGNFYLKSDTSSLTADDKGNYSSNIRAWWYLKED